MILPPISLPAGAVRDESQWYWNGQAWEKTHRPLNATYEGKLTKRLQVLGDNEFTQTPLAKSADAPPELWYEAYPSQVRGQRWLVVRSPHPWTQELHQKLGAPTLYNLNGEKISTPELAPDTWMIPWSQSREWGKSVQELGGQLARWEPERETLETTLRVWETSLQANVLLDDAVNLDAETALARQKELNEQYEAWQGYIQTILDEILPYLYRPHPRGEWANAVWAKAQELWKRSMLQLESNAESTSIEEAALPYLRAIWPEWPRPN